ncbi:2OG-Fe(II) oxygenase superfamily protein [Synechococcus phage S-SCSM1]|uniref:2OG-Fe(II) oxygenase superfamily protein n=1 Tax=Synechococcus phage S-SCSM1 TaxID=2588487 RepID=A0A6M2ZHD9_9CAUD|nr:2OG-Fe(II) oxygenase superfamily protein [Synechococcus phage S-SCSM1]QFG06320.1 2OG-Fe(II) oxygenase superfamily protein [Synechococcus phage S-SCSM1]
MQVCTNVLSSELLEHCQKEIIKLSAEQVWGSSHLRWNENIKDGIVGSCLQSYVPEKTHEMLVHDLHDEYFSNKSEYLIQYYIWQPNSGISFHNDSYDGRIGATIYLNETWNQNHGGLFLWYDDHPIVMRAISPQQNMMIISDAEQKHAVTQISPLCDEPRYTIQMWIT